MRLSRRRADADDLMQDTLEHAYVAYDDFELGTNPRPWLVTIMRNLFLDHCRRRARARCDGDGSLARMAAPVLEEVPRWRTIEVSQIESALTSVDAALKRAFVLRWHEQRSYREIAGQLRIPLNTVGTRLLRARRMIRAALESEDVSTGKKGTDRHEP